MALRLSPSVQNLAPHLRWAAPLGVVVLASLFGHHFGLSIGMLIVAGGVLCGSIWLIWSSLQGLASDAPLTLDEALSLGAPTAEEEQKRAVLRALKDLEYERAVGKINDADYATLAEHYRGEAKRLLRAVDEDMGPERERAEQLLAERMAAQEAAEPTTGTAEAAASKLGSSAAGSRRAASSSTNSGSANSGNGTDSDDDSDPAVVKSPSSGAAP